MGWSWETCHDVDAGVMALRRFGEEVRGGGQEYLQGVLLRAHLGADRRDRSPA